MVEAQREALRGLVRKQFLVARERARQLGRSRLETLLSCREIARASLAIRFDHPARQHHERERGQQDEPESHESQPATDSGPRYAMSVGVSQAYPLRGTARIVVVRENCGSTRVNLVRMFCTWVAMVLSATLLPSASHKST